MEHHVIIGNLISNLRKEKPCHKCKKEFTGFCLRTCEECEKSFCKDCSFEAFAIDFANTGEDQSEPLCDICWSSEC
jgi:hypothetical protein